ncbi:MAG TPA: hypothetical protein VMH80_01695 [Bryobacteraceae bacterium]|nr:hypothetical protein [Bryobacteraceae bacterium]
MKRFEFSLERVRRWRSEQASLEELKLRQMIASRAQLEGARRQAEAQGRRAADQLLAKASLEASELHQLDAYRLHIHRLVTDLDNRARQCEAQIAKQRQRVIEARRQFELLDRLRTTALAEWRAASNKEQEDLAAELFLAKSRRNT